MDHADMAEKDILQFLDRAITAAHGMKDREALPGSKNIHCCDCGVEIPPARREAVAECKCCIDCAELNELMQKGTNHPISQATQFSELDENISNYDL